MGSETLAVVLTLTSLGLLVYTYVGYPALLWLFNRVLPAPESLSTEPTEWPDVSIVLSAYNEEDVIAERMQNLLELDYPRERLEILVGSDGSTDRTCEIVNRFNPQGIRLVPFAQRRGKASVVNDLVAQARGEIVVLTDARQWFERSALWALVRPFADPLVGAVSGEVILCSNAKGTAVGEGLRAYWRYEKFIRWNESRVDSTVGASGAIYAIRRDFFEPIPEDTILDDVLIPMKIARRGYRILFAPGARAWDRAAATARDEFARKVRTIAGNFQLFARESWLLHPFRNRLWVQTISHKGLRLLSPFGLAVAFGANLMLLDSPLYRGLLLGQLVFYLAAFGGYLLRNARTKIPFLSVPYTFCLLHWTTVVAYARFLTGRQTVTWERTREASMEERDERSRTASYVSGRVIFKP